MTIQAHFLEQAVACEKMGSPFTARLCRMFANNLTRRCKVSECLLDWPGDSSNRGDSVPLRMAAALHALVLSGRATKLAAVYPPDNPRASDADIWQAAEFAQLEQEDFILDWLKSPPQTNETARNAALKAGFHQLTALTGKPLVLSEVGASAGLNMNWDHYALNVKGQVFGPRAANLVLTPKWHGELPPDATPVVQGKQGCDIQPIDATDADQQLRLLAYIWPDQPERAKRLKQAFACLAEHPVDLVKSDALIWLQSRLRDIRLGAVHVIYHSVAWQYLDVKARQTGEDMINAAGHAATPDAPLARLCMESDGGQSGAALTLQIWPDGRLQNLGRADFHGRWVKWDGVG